jgi:hypothetical protein
LQKVTGLNPNAGHALRQKPACKPLLQKPLKPIKSLTPFLLFAAVQKAAPYFEGAAFCVVCALFYKPRSLGGIGIL